MSELNNLKKLSYLVYGLGTTGHSVIKYFKKNKINNFYVWDDNKILRKKFKNKRVQNLHKSLKEVDFIVLSPGISLRKSKYKKKLSKYKNKIITDIDLLYLSGKEFRSIIVTGSNGKSTTCKIISHLLKKNKFNTKLGGNIGTPILNLKINKNDFFIIEASSFQLAHSKFIHPNYAILLNITNDHLDWHGSSKDYEESKLKIFNLQTRSDYALINKKLINIYKKKKYLSKLITLKFNSYKKVKTQIKNDYLKSKTNDENMNFVYTLSKLLNISNISFIKSMNSFVGLNHRYEIFLRKKNIIFINDSKATSFESSKFALESSKNIFWILGGLPKENDKINLKYLKKNIIHSYIIGKKADHFKKQLKNKVNFTVTQNLKNSIKKALNHIKLFKKKYNIILLSPTAASFDQFKNFEYRGNEFKKLCKLYAKKYI
jgi:UDP-N-acetylmuramoylalanine--D-glutamate ligase